MLSLGKLTRPAPPQTPLRRAMKHLLEMVLTETGLPAPLRVIAQSYFIRATDEQLDAIVDTLENVAVQLRAAQREGTPDMVEVAAVEARALPVAGLGQADGDQG